MTVQEQLQSGLTHHQAGRLVEAETSYRLVLAEEPEQADALHLLGMLAGYRGEWKTAAELIGRAVARKPDFAEAHNNLGFALAGQGKIDKAIESYRRAIELKPDLGEAYNNLGYALRELGQIEEAITFYREGVRLRPDYAEGWNFLGGALIDAGKLDEAIVACRRALELKPDLAEAHNNLGNALRSQRQLDEAIASYQRAIQIGPDLMEARNNSGNALAEVGEFDEAVAAYREALRLKPDYVTAHSNLALVLLYQPEYDARMIFEELQRWDRQHAEPLKGLIGLHDNDRSTERRLRVGYVSPDFRNHVVGQNILPLFREHDHAAVEVFCYANVLQGDAVTEEFKRHADVWRGIAGLSNTAAADLIRKDGIDILVDLALHTGNNRLLIFAQKPAPVQVTFAGYPGSTGLEAIDYRLTDPYLDPPGGSDEFYSEESVRLADSFWCYEPTNPEMMVNLLPAEGRGYVTFGCLNNFCKVNEGVLRLWARVLKSVDRSRLLMLCPPGRHRESVLGILEREGVDRDRVELIANQPRAKYFELYHGIDVGLDTVPYNGHTTSLDSLWMGVPVVTLVGKTVVGRAGLSQLSNLGLTELVARSAGEFVEIAASLAGDLGRMAELRRTLRGRMEGSALMDGRRFARNIEGVYRHIWRKWCAS